MQHKKINLIIQWWVTPKLPEQDIFAKHNFISQWLVHPIKRRLARWYLKLLQKYTDIKVIAVTGSAGKSTTVQMIASILKLKGRTAATPPSIDPVYNVPNTILKVPYGTKYLVLEFSVEFPGEMDYYLWLAKPDIGLITNIFPTHTEHLKSIQGVWEEKGKLVLSLLPGSFAILNQEDGLLKKAAQRLKAKVVWFKGTKDPISQNSAAAVACAKVLGVDDNEIKSGLKNYSRPRHRLEVIKLSSGATILDDTYNSNPSAAVSALYVFDKLAGSGRKVAVLGQMLELGEYEEVGHRRVGREASRLGLDFLIAVGGASKFIVEEVERHSPKTQSYFVENAAEVVPILRPIIDKNIYILIKGSRSVGLDKVVDKLV